jgi:hypothetical protein
MKAKLPKQIRVGAKRYEVVRKYATKSELGHIQYEDPTIFVATRDRGGIRLSVEDQHETFWHELTHGILHDMNHPLRDNERFVKAFSKRLNRAIFSAKF